MKTFVGDASPSLADLDENFATLAGAPLLDAATGFMRVGTQSRNHLILNALNPVGVYQNLSEKDSYLESGRVTYVDRPRIAYHDLLRHRNTLVNPLTGRADLGTINYAQALVPTGSGSPPYWTDPGTITLSNPTVVSVPGQIDFYDGFVRFTSPRGYGSPAPSHPRVQANFAAVSGRQRVAWDLSFRVPEEDDFPFDPATGWDYSFLLWQLKGAPNPSLWIDCVTSPDGRTATLNLRQKLSSQTGDTDTVRLQWNQTASGNLNAGSSRSLWSATFQKGDWVDLLLEVFLDERKTAPLAGGCGYLNLYRDGVQVFAYSGPTLNARNTDGSPAPANYWMVGIYRQESSIPPASNECDLNRLVDPAPYSRMIDFRVARLLTLPPMRSNPDGGIVGTKLTDVALAGSTTETVLYQVSLVGYTLKPGDVLSVHPIVQTNASANAKTLRVRFGAYLAVATTVYSSVSDAATQAMGPRVALRMRDVLTSQIMEHTATTGTAAAEGYASSASAPATAAIDFRATQVLFITGQLANASDTLTLKSVVVRIERANYT